MTDGDLVGRRELIDSILTAIDDGCHLFAFEGITGIGKSALLAAIVAELQLGDNSVASVNAADQANEELAIASIIMQLKGLARKASVAEALTRRASELPVFRRIIGAIAADLIKFVAEKAEHTIDVAQELIAGDREAPDVFADLDALDQANRRAFLSRFLQAIDDAGVSPILVIDNVDRQESSDFIRFLIGARALGTVIFLAHNTERGDNVSWDYIVADVKANRGMKIIVSPLTRHEVEQWFNRDVGRWPSPTESAALAAKTDGRPYGLRLAIDAIRSGAATPILGDYSDYYAIRRQALNGHARTVAELLAIMPNDFSIPVDSLAVAAKALGVDDIGPSLDQLKKERWLKEQGSRIALSHSLAQDVWRQALTADRTSTLKLAWYAAVFAQLSGVKLSMSPDIALFPVVLTALATAKSREEIAELGAQLVESGQFEIGLPLLDEGWRFEQHGNLEGVEMFQHALLAAETRLNLGRYAEVDEPLRQAEMVATDTAARLRVVLLQMKLALRRNAYALLWNLSEHFEQLSVADLAARADGLSTLNVAYRDHLDHEGISQTTEQLIALRPSLGAERRAAVDRSIARALAKNGRLEEALAYSEEALSAASDLGLVRDTGNAYLARAEVRRYRSDYDGAEADYLVSQEIARGIGNRDSQLWALLGQAAANIEGGVPDKAKQPLEQIAALLAEPGYIHPLEAAHAGLLRALVGLDTKALAEVIRPYSALGIKWPTAFLEKFHETGVVAKPIPL